MVETAKRHLKITQIFENFVANLGENWIWIRLKVTIASDLIH
jgi:hypothetical protein